MILKEKFLLSAILIVALLSQNCFTSIPGSHKRLTRNPSDVSPLQSLHAKKHHPVFNDGSTVDGSLLQLYTKQITQHPPLFDQAENGTILQLGTGVPSITKEIDVIHPKLKYKQDYKIEQQKHLREAFSDVSLYSDPKEHLAEEKHRSVNQAFDGDLLRCSPKRNNGKEDKQLQNKRIQHIGTPRSLIATRQQDMSPPASPEKAMQQPGIHSQQPKLIQHQGSLQQKLTTINPPKSFLKSHGLHSRHKEHQKELPDSNSIAQGNASPMQGLSKNQGSSQLLSKSDLASIKSLSLQDNLLETQGSSLHLRQSVSVPIKLSSIAHSQQDNLLQNQELLQQPHIFPVNDPIDDQETLKILNQAPSSRGGQSIQTQLNLPSTKLYTTPENVSLQPTKYSQRSKLSQEEDSSQNNRPSNSIKIKLPADALKNTTHGNVPTQSLKISQGQESQQSKKSSNSFKIKLLPVIGNRLSEDQASQQRPGTSPSLENYSQQPEVLPQYSKLPQPVSSQHQEVSQGQVSQQPKIPLDSIIIGLAAPKRYALEKSITSNCIGVPIASPQKSGPSNLTSLKPPTSSENVLQHSEVLPQHLGLLQRQWVSQRPELSQGQGSSEKRELLNWTSVKSSTCSKNVLQNTEGLSQHSVISQRPGSILQPKSSNSALIRQPTIPENTQNFVAAMKDSQSQSQSLFPSPNPAKIGRKSSPSMSLRHLEMESRRESSPSMALRHIETESRKESSPSMALRHIETETRRESIHAPSMPRIGIKIETNRESSSMHCKHIRTETDKISYSSSSLIPNIGHQQMSNQQKPHRRDGK